MIIHQDAAVAAAVDCIRDAIHKCLRDHDQTIGVYFCPDMKEAVRRELEAMYERGRASMQHISTQITSEEEGWVVEVVHWPRSPLAMKRDEARLTARRLAVCWNACDGIDTEALELRDEASLEWLQRATIANKIARIQELEAELAVIREEALPETAVERLELDAITVLQAALQRSERELTSRRLHELERHASEWATCLRRGCEIDRAALTPPSTEP